MTKKKINKYAAHLVRRTKKASPGTREKMHVAALLEILLNIAEAFCDSKPEEVGGLVKVTKQYADEFHPELQDIISWKVNYCDCERCQKSKQQTSLSE